MTYNIVLSKTPEVSELVQNKKIGIVVLNYCDSDTTAKMCKKISAYNSIDSIVIVDNMSPDHSMDVLKTLADDKVDVIQTKRNGGYSYGNNFGAFYLIEKKSVDIVYIANPDVEFDEAFVNATATHIITNKAHAVSGIMINRDGRCGINSININSFKDDVLDCTLVLKKFMPTKKISLAEEFVYTEFLYGSLFAIDANVFEEIGGFDENVFLYCEERILGTKMLQCGYRLGIDTTTKYLHLHAVSINKAVTKYRQVCNLYNSRIYFRRKYARDGQVAILVLKLVMLYGRVTRKIAYWCKDLVTKWRGCCG